MSDDDDENEDDDDDIDDDEDEDEDDDDNDDDDDDDSEKRSLAKITKKIKNLIHLILTANDNVAWINCCLYISH